MLFFSGCIALENRLFMYVSAFACLYALVFAFARPHMLLHIVA